jgi:hypothetical protein
VKYFTFIKIKKNMSGNHNETRKHKLSVLTKDLELNQVRNSTIFENQEYFVLSPSVQNRINWFDLRKINLDKKPANKKGFLIIRLIEDFILVDLNKIITDLCNSEPYETQNSGIHWKFQIGQTNWTSYTFLTQKVKQE